MSMASLAARRVLPFVASLLVGPPGVLAAQVAAVQQYAQSTVDVGWATGPGSLFGPGFTFTPTTNVFVTALSFFNPDSNGGAQGFNSAGDPSFATSFTVVLAEIAASGNATALAWVTVDDASTVRAVSSGGVTGAFFSTALMTPYALLTGKRYAVFGSNDQGLLSFGAGWDAGTIPPDPVTSPLIAFGTYIAGTSNVSDLGTNEGVSILTAPDPDIAFSTGASMELTTASPEPATALLVATGLTVLVGVSRRRRSMQLHPSRNPSPGATMRSFGILFLAVALTTALLGGCRDANDLVAPRTPLQGAAQVIVYNINVPRVPLAMGQRHVCALTRAGQTYCWGHGFYGELGTSTPVTSYSPVPVAQGALRFNALTAGTSFTCALTATGQAYCWGSNEVLNGTALVPTLVQQGTLKFTSIQAGSNSVCALAVGGRAYCWGLNVNGQLGNGEYGCCGPAPTTRETPVAVAQGALVFTSITAHGYDVCALTPGGAAYCWGDNGAGQVGDGTTRPAVATPTAVHQGPLVFVSLQSSNETTCGLTGTGKLYCWGSNFYGDFADGLLEFYAPYPMPGAPGFSFTSLASLGRGACGLTAATSSTMAGQAYCWGWDGYGELGNADFNYQAQPLPVPVYTGTLFTLLANNGGPGMCALAATGQVYCWGQNGNGQLGIGSLFGFPNEIGPVIPYPVLVQTDQLFG